jgi:hypothetical protein
VPGSDSIIVTHFFRHYRRKHLGVLVEELLPRFEDRLPFAIPHRDRAVDGGGELRQGVAAVSLAHPWAFHRLLKELRGTCHNQRSNHQGSGTAFDEQFLALPALRTPSFGERTPLAFGLRLQRHRKSWR